MSDCRQRSDTVESSHNPQSEEDMQQSETYKRGSAMQSCCQWQEARRKGHGVVKVYFKSLEMSYMVTDTAMPCCLALCFW